MNNHFVVHKLFILITLCSVTGNVYAQHTNDEFKLQLKKSLGGTITKPELNQLPKSKALQIRPLNEESEVLKVSPTTKLPTRYDKIQTINQVSPEEIVDIELNYTNKDYKSQLARTSIDYSDGKVQAIPDARSITQSAQYTRNDYGLGVYADEDSPEFMRKIRNKVTPIYRDLDLDPIRTIQRIKSRNRQKKVDVILKAYDQK
ncbi:MAG: hypothetical protein VB024_05145 [Dysgonamonadaceae bacterium]|jgi:hypothetical protein|nr:hypothetical protein [Dysgonamonadaceae bacterium]MDD3308375.1 hypothetical protein [Dysgonamonadaceae bacterium]MDD3900203.1 hypothetical protein [Dysgonamonadaceae bacterium]MDD4398867.1 hypothetical protein [Dysgonamonadaceae bacterium]MEA5080992.1 hypothetical protein [Dysgonamonadaceae bacterium]